jgi:AraC family transcriptional regulator of adaptative response/methylated-DNA-[protein]-cysteine methyltransferase
MNEIYWQAFKNRDKRFDGVFWTAVKTTKIFCKPSCTAKLPKPENVDFYKTWQDAESKGFRACLRCKPKTFKTINPQVEIVIKTCELLETVENLSLEHLGESLKINPNYLQKIFKEIIGVSPKKYLEKLRLDKFKDEIKKGNDVVNAIYESGYGSNRALYENVNEKLGMTPKIYKQGGKNVKVEFTIADCKLGKILVAKTEKGLCSVTLGDDEKVLSENLRVEFSKAEITENKENLKEFVEAILQNLAGTNKTLDLPLDLQATAFQMQVWQVLRKIPFGETLSYKEVAEKLGNQKAVRAVARACASNRVALVIPCHRVVGSNGSLSGYRWGIERKDKLLNLENINK